MSATYILLTKPDAIHQNTYSYSAYVAKLAGFKLEAGVVLKEFKITGFPKEATQHFSAAVASFNSTTYHSEKVYMLIDLGYEHLDDLVNEINADVCSLKWRWVAAWLVELTKLMGVDDYEVVGFKNAPVQALVFDKGAAALRKIYFSEPVRLGEVT